MWLKQTLINVAKTSLIAFCGFCVSLQLPARTYAMNRDVKTVLIWAGYGTVAGTAVGLASYPLHESTRGIFIGSSVGYYLGAAVGFVNLMIPQEVGEVVPLLGSDAKGLGVAYRINY